MAEIAQYQFSFKEVTEMLVKRQGLHEGVWAIGFNLNIGTGLMGNGPEQIFPSAMVQITSAILTRVEAGQPVPPSAVDAAVANPRDATASASPAKPRGKRVLI